MRLDLQAWRKFLAPPMAYSRPFSDFSEQVTAVKVDFFMDAAKSEKLGCGGHCGKQWFFIRWQAHFLCLCDPSISYLELYAVTVGIYLWIHKFKNSKIILFCNNEAAVAMINNTSSSCKNCMVLLRLIVLQGLIHNVKIRAKYVRSKANRKADMISRREFALFHQLSNYEAELQPCKIPRELWPIEKIWLK